MHVIYGLPSDNTDNAVEGLLFKCPSVSKSEPWDKIALD